MTFCNLLFILLRVFGQEIKTQVEFLNDVMLQKVQLTADRQNIQKHPLILYLHHSHFTESAPIGKIKINNWGAIIYTLLGNHNISQ